MKCFNVVFLTLLATTVYAQKPEVVISSGHTDVIHSVDISSDGNWIATGSNDKLVKIIDNQTGKELRTFDGNDGYVTYVKFDQSAQFVSAYVSSQHIKTWNISSGELISEFLASSAYGEFDFVLDNSRILFINDDGFVSLQDYRNKTEPKVLAPELAVQRCKSDWAGEHAFLIDITGRIMKMDLKTGEIVQEVQYFDEFVYSPTRMDVDHSGDFLAITFRENEIHILNTKDLSNHAILRGHVSRIKDIKFDEKTSTLFSLEHNNDSLYVWDVKKSKLFKRAKVSTMSSECIEPHPKQDVIMLTDWKSLLYVNKKRLKVLKRFTSKSNKIVNLAYDQKGKYLAASSLDMTVKLWDLEQNKIVRSFQAFWPVAIDPDGDYLLANYMSVKIGVWDIHSGEMLDELPTDGDLIQQIAFSADGKLVAGIGIRGFVFIWDIESRKIVQKIKWTAGMTYGVAFSPDGSKLATSGLNGSIYIWDVETGDQITLIEGYLLMFSSLKFSPDGKSLVAANWDKKVHIFDVETWEEKMVLEGHTNTIHTVDISSDGQFIASGAGNNAVWQTDNSVAVWDMNTGNLVCKYDGHFGAVNKVIFDQTSDLVYSCGDDGAIKAWRFKDCDEVGTYISVYNQDYVITTPDFYYMASKDALDAVSFRVKDQLFPFDQFDLKLNRPDIVSSRLGKTPQGLINAYAYVYKKRLRKMNFKEEDLGEDFHLPELKILDEDIPLITSESALQINVEGSDDKYLLDRINVYINDVPLFGINGISLKSYETQSLRHKLEVPLISGENKIQVSVHNAKGVESLRQTVSVLRDEVDAKGDLYLITIGVSEYQDSRFTLKYPVKDGRDVVETISKSKELYHNVYHRELYDSLVTIEKIAELESFLSKAKPDDAVVIFVAGHGVLNEKFEYYFGTYDMDFDNPSERGLAYDRLDALMLNTKAIRKLLIMDTCHSGEVDKDEVEAVNDIEVEVDDDVEFRSAGQGVRQKQAFGLYNSVELMESMFSDIRRGSGANVISSAGGAEYAMESDQWQNGLFTYCLLIGLNDQNADTDRNGEIIISELKHYIYEQVRLLSHGKQKPTSREENTSMDYRIW